MSDDCVLYERRKETNKIDEFIERQGIRSAELCVIIDDIDRHLNRQDEVILKLKEANNFNIDNSIGEINELKSQLEKYKQAAEYGLEVAEFYGDKDSWEPNSLYKKTNSYFDAFINEDEENVATGKYIGGKLARELKPKIEKLLK